MILSTAEYGVASHVASRFACEVASVRGYFRGTTDSWLHIHDKAKLPGDSENVAPKRSFKLYGGAPFSWDFDPPLVMSNGCVCSVSIDEDDQEASAELADWFVVGNGQLVVAGTSIAGDMVTADNILDVFTSAATLYEIKVTVNTSAVTDRWVQVFKDVQESGLVSGTTAFNVQQKIPAGTTPAFVFNFGNAGLAWTKCCVAQSSTGTVFTTSANNHLYIQGVYKA